ncbi:WD repeat, SAM and U-box domain-containing protein 1-like [Tubulanus polymorphus]|uniref:WD repeat, SAM and U-box domain-containing protein 1-like n=1 Tax=Tubulanus polymorphus TaxID=672921 RepID=UPI003DA6A1E7
MMFSKQELDGHPVENWTVNDVQKWMLSVSLQSVKHIFVSYGIDGKTLLSIDREFLGQRGIYERDLQTKILSAIYEGFK